MDKRLKSVDRDALRNTVMLYILTAAKILFPLLTLPFLTRVLSIECYGVLAYVKSVVVYAQIIVDFGFLLSSVKAIVRAGDKREVGGIVGDTVLAKILLGFVAFGLILILGATVPSLQGYRSLLLLSFLPAFLSAFLLDYFFRGIERMQVVSLLYVLMKGVSTLLTILLVRSDADLLLIPLLDILSSALAISIAWIIYVKMGYGIRFGGLRSALRRIKESCLYFTNGVASSAFGAMNTAVLGFFIADFEQLAFWSVSMQLVGAIQIMYTPISQGIYPYMIKTKSLKAIKGLLFLGLPCVVCAALFAGAASPTLLGVIGGEEYREAFPIFCSLLPILVLSFPVAILAWPCLGAIDRVKEINIATLVGALIQIVGLALLLMLGRFTVLGVAGVRNLSELGMCSALVFFVMKYRAHFKR